MWFLVLCPSVVAAAFAFRVGARFANPAPQANIAGTLLSGARHFTDSNAAVCNHHLGVSAFSQFTVAAQESLVKIDASLPLAKAALFGCAVMTGVGAVVNTARVVPGTSVAVFGMGGVGLSAIMGARAVGAHPIVAVDRLGDKLKLARELGATHTVNAAKDDSVEAVRELTAGGADYAFESVGNETVLIQAYRSDPTRRHDHHRRLARAGKVVHHSRRQSYFGRAHDQRLVHGLVRAAPRHSALHQDVSGGTSAGGQVADAHVCGLRKSTPASIGWPRDRRCDS